MKLEMRSAFRVYGRPVGRPGLSPSWKHRQCSGYAAVMWFRARDTTAVLPLHYAQSRAWSNRVTRTWRAEREWESQDQEGTLYLTNTSLSMYILMHFVLLKKRSLWVQPKIHYTWLWEARLIGKIIIFNIFFVYIAQRRRMMNW